MRFSRNSLGQDGNVRPIKTVTERHLEAYRLWKIYQNHARVAQEIGVHVDTVATWSSFFEWRKKLAEDIANGDGNTMAMVAGFRKNAITVTDLIQGWTKNLALMHETVIREEREFTEEEKLVRARYIEAIKTFDPRAMNNLLAYLKASYQFDLGTGGGTEGERLPERPAGEGGIKFQGPTLVMFGPNGKGGKDGERLFTLQGTGSKARTRLIGNFGNIAQAERAENPSGRDDNGGGAEDGAGETMEEIQRGDVEDSRLDRRSNGADDGANGDRVADSPWA